MHLDDSTLHPYISRSLDAPGLRAFDDHLASCLQCLLVVEAAGFDPDRWERRGILGRLVRVTPSAVPAVEQSRAERRLAA
jgi:hypothetical protein